MALFYAYLKNVGNCPPVLRRLTAFLTEVSSLSNQSNRDDWDRYIITFVDRETADEWWRLVSTFPSPYAGNIQRISPQFYTQNDFNNSVVHFFDNTRLSNARQFFEKMFFTLLNDRDERILSVIPPIEITDHISGRWYFIRCKAFPQKHWYCRISDECLVCGDANCDVIHISSEHCTKFYIEARNLAIGDFQVPKDLVMIGSDKISIAVSRDYSLRVNDAHDLKSTKVNLIATSDLLFLFDDLKNKFASRIKKREDGDTWEHVKPVEKGLGLSWELVDD